MTFPYINISQSMLAIGLRCDKSLLHIYGEVKPIYFYYSAQIGEHSTVMTVSVCLLHIMARNRRHNRNSVGSSMG